MRKKEEKLVLTFHTTSEAMRAEKFLVQNAFSGRLIPVPGEITAGCGLAWKAEPWEKEKLVEALKENEIAFDKAVVLVI